VDNKVVHKPVREEKQIKPEMKKNYSNDGGVKKDIKAILKPDEPKLPKKNNIKDLKKDSISEKATNPALLKGVQEGWEGFVEEISRNNFSLSTILKVCNPVEMRDGRIVLVCKFDFHKEKLNDLKNKNLVEEAADDYFKDKVNFELIMQEDIDNDLKKKMQKFESIRQKKKKESDIAVNQALNIFGGKMDA
jgi:hypothetical protein